MYRVLVPVDRSVERAKEQIEYVTSLPGAPDGIDVQVLFVNKADYAGAKERTFEDVESATMVRDALTDAGISCEGKMREGMIARNILSEAEEFDADEIVMAGRDRSGTMKVLLGSVTQDIILSSERPVVVVG